MGSTLYLFMFMRFLLLLTSFYLMVANSSSAMRQPLCHDSESSALLQFKQSFLIDERASDDPSAYPKVATWKSHGEGEGEESDCCSWDGVECDRETGHVIGLHLASSCLYGSINSSSTLFSLVHLRRLDLSDNDFNYYVIPFGVGQLSRLRSLDLSYSRFSGQIPSELLALSKLVFLDLAGNPMLQLQKPGLRNLVQNLTHLKTLHLSYVNISSTIPHALANLSSLTSLFLRECGLHGEFPMTIFWLPSLRYLSVRIPQCMANFSKSLIVLDLGNNSLDGPIPQTCTVPNNLRVIDLGENQFQGQIPRSFANCMMLEHLVLILRSNRFHGAIGSWHANLRFPKLRIIDLSGNEFIGDLPSVYFQNWDAMKLADANHLKYMRVNQDFHSLGYTYTFIYMYSMTMTNKGMQRFYEEIPDIFIAIDFSGLHLLNLGGNNLTGLIPSSLANLTQLESLDLSHNKLSGEIPWQLARMTFLEFFNVSHNHLTGHIPQGNQFTTFPDAAFDGNPGLCGSPLSKACESYEASPPTLSSSKQGLTIEFDWKFVLMGYGSGLVIGVSIGIA
ncbi:hypothetical protein AAG906_039958 [Vitis piasezkii]